MSLIRNLRSVGLDPGPVLVGARQWSTFAANRRKFLAQAQGRSEWEIGDDWPCLTDRHDQGGAARGQYFHQDLLVAQAIFAQRPARHVDVGSRVDGFVAHVATFMEIEVLDIRPSRSSASNITFVERDLMQPDPAFDDYTDSLSCLHTLEHFGLGRYGDPIDYDGYRRGWASLVRMLRPGGTFHFSVPISQRPRIEFDAHRLFDVPRVLEELVDPDFEVVRASVVDDTEELRTDVDVRGAEAGRTFGIDYGCLVLELRKHAAPHG